MHKVNFTEARQKIADANRILILTHRAPDGDAIGSILALYHVLKRFGKDVCMGCADPVPVELTFLNGSEDVKYGSELSHFIKNHTFDLVITVDVAQVSQLGHVNEEHSQFIAQHTIINF